MNKVYLRSDVSLHDYMKRTWLYTFSNRKPGSEKRIDPFTGLYYGTNYGYTEKYYCIKCKNSINVWEVEL